MNSPVIVGYRVDDAYLSTVAADKDALPAKVEHIVSMRGGSAILAHHPSGKKVCTKREECINCCPTKCVIA